MRVAPAVAAAFAMIPTGSALAAEGEWYRIAVSYETQTEGAGSSSSSRGRTVYSEQILSDSGDCTVKRFDIVDEEGRERPLAEWQWPVEVERCGNEARRMLNLPEMEARLATFLETADIPREACGRHYFTWNVFRIECDPQAVLPTIEAIDLGSLTLADGAEYAQSGIPRSATLVMVSADDGMITLRTEFAVDPVRFREETARTEVVVGDVMGEAVSYKDALAQAQKMEVSGSIVITFEKATDMSSIRQSVVTRLIVEEPGDGQETRYSKVTTHRKRVAQ